METKSYVLVIDQGTSSTRAFIYNLKGGSRHGYQLQSVASGRQTFQQYYPQAAWVEHDLEEIWQSVIQSVAQALLAARDIPDFKSSQIVAMGITNQRETLCFFDAQNSRPVCPAIVWQCKRSEGICQQWQEQGFEEIIRQKTGLCVDPYFSASKLVWALESHQGLKERLNSKQVLVGTIDSYLIHRLTKGQVFATEPSNASRTQLFALESSWDRSLMKMLDCPIDIYASVKDSAGVFGMTDVDGLLPHQIAITGVLGDQQAAALGQQCLKPGELKCTYGTGAFLMMQAGDRPMLSQKGLLTTVGWQVSGQRSYMLEGSSFIAGAGVDYLKDQWGFLNSADEASDLQVGASPDIMFIPEFAGLGAPFWNAQVRGTLLGLSRDTTRKQVIRALLEGVVFRVTDLVEAASADLSVFPQALQVDGGMSRNEESMQFQADMLGIPVRQQGDIEVTALGAAIIAAFGCGVIPSLQISPQTSSYDDLDQGQVFYPTMDLDQRAVHRAAWAKALQAALLFAS